MFFDSIGAVNKLPIIGNEFLEFKFRSPIDAGGDEEINVQIIDFKCMKNDQ